MGDVVHIAPAVRSRLPLVMTDKQRKALKALQSWLDQCEDGNIYLTHHSMCEVKFELVDLMVRFAEENGPS